MHGLSWTQFIQTPIKKSGGTSVGYRAMQLLKHKVLDSVLLRRTKDQCAADLALPPRTVSLSPIVGSLPLRDLCWIKPPWMSPPFVLKTENQIAFGCISECLFPLGNYTVQCKLHSTWGEKFKLLNLMCIKTKILWLMIEIYFLSIDCT